MKTSNLTILLSAKVVKERIVLSSHYSGQVADFHLKWSMLMGKSSKHYYRKKELRKTDYLSLLQSLEINLRQELLILFEREDKD